MSVGYERIYLIGLPGSGKSTLGQALAHRLGWNFLDTDRLIEAITGRTVAELFREKGEPYFRLLESQVLHDCSTQTNAVIATGGGAPVHHGNMELMLAGGFTVWLNPDLSEIAKRLRAESGLRPLLEQTDAAGIEVRLSELLQQRIPYYQKSALTMNGTYSENDVYQVVQKVLA